MTKIVLTGGPCAGKTTGLSMIRDELTELGYTVLIVPETATELITGGVAPWTLKTNTDYQSCQMKLQLYKEKVFEEAADKLPDNSKVIIVCDRGAMDNKAYMTDAEFDRVIAELGLSLTELRDGYDAVFHLVTAAKGAEEFYTLSNNGARTETVEEAAERDDKLISAWTGHPHFRVIDNKGDFKDKMRHLLKEITSFLGEPEPLEIERKFLIKYPDLEKLESDSSCRRVEIIQTYLTSSEGEETRVRQRGENGSYIYVRTTKRSIDGLRRVEVEKRLTKDEYLAHLMLADPNKRPIRKNRYCLTYKNQYFEIDVYPFWDDKAIVELELSDENAEILFPDFLEVIKEVTDDPEYKNSSLARL